MNVYQVVNADKVAVTVAALKRIQVSYTDYFSCAISHYLNVCRVDAAYLSFSTQVYYVLLFVLYISNHVDFVVSPMGSV